MATQLRHEINILCSAYSAANATISSNEIVQTNPSVFNGTLTFYFEVEGTATAGSTGNIRLRRVGTTTDDITIATSGLGTSSTLLRSASFVPPTTAQQYFVFIDAGGTGKTVTLKSARIIILQNALPIQNSEHQFEIGNAQSFTATTLTALTNPKYWHYDASKWNGSVVCFFEATMRSNGSTKVTATAEIQVSDGTGDGFTGWAGIAGGVSFSDVTATTASITWQRTGFSFAPINGRNYRVVVKTSNSKCAVNIYNAKVIVQQNHVANIFPSVSSEELIFGSGGTSEAIRQPFISVNTGVPISVGLQLRKQIGGAPTDNLRVSIFDTGGSEIIRGQIAGTSLTASFAAYTVNFSTVIDSTKLPLTAGTTYYLTLARDGARDATNGYSAGINVIGSFSPVLQNENSGVWSDLSSENIYFTINGLGGFTLSEPQYLLANTLLAAGTGLQTFLTKWDSTEWIGVNNAYEHAVDAANNSTSVVELDTAGGTQVAGSSVASPDNQGISGLLTMPADGNLDVKATTNNGDVNGSRILAQVNVVETSLLGIPFGHGGQNQMNQLLAT